MVLKIDLFFMQMFLLIYFSTVFYNLNYNNSKYLKTV